MISINDLYYKLDSGIVDRGFWKVNIDEKKQLIDSELKKYITFKLKELGNNTSLLSEKENSTSVNDLLKILARVIPKEDHFDNLRHFTHYILAVAGSLQNYSICWWVEEEDELINMPLIELDDSGQWTSLKTHKETDYVKTFDFVYDVFTNNFMTKSNSKKLLFKKFDKEQKKV